MIHSTKKMGLVWFAICSGLIASAQNRPAIPPGTGTDKPAAETPKSAPKPYKDVITAKAITSSKNTNTYCASNS